MLVSRGGVARGRLLGRRREPGAGSRGRDRMAPSESRVDVWKGGEAAIGAGLVPGGTPPRPGMTSPTIAADHPAPSSTTMHRGCARASADTMCASHITLTLRQRLIIHRFTPVPAP
jgi:hypothetical protein